MKNKKTNSILIGCLSIPIIFFIFFVMLVSCTSDDITTNDKTANGIDCAIEAEYFIKYILKSPSTAKFSKISDRTTNIFVNDDIIIVSGFVDAQNSFGATTRSYYEGKCQNNNELIYLNFDGKVLRK